MAEVYDGTHQTPNYVNEGIRFVSVEDINDLYNSTKFISEADYQKYKHVPTVGDIIMTRIGSIGKCAIVDREEPLAYYVSVSLLKLNHEMIDSRYLKYYLESDFGDKELKLRSLLKAFPMKINLKEIPQVRLILPEIAEQIKFVDVVKQADKSKFSGFKSRFIEMFSIRQLPLKHLPDLSENLDKKRVPITSGDRKSGMYPYYGASGIVDYVDDYIFDETLLLISEDGANLKDRVTPIAFQASGKFWVNNHAHVLRFASSAMMLYIEYLLNGMKIEKYLTGMAQPKLKQKELNTIPIPVPSDSELQCFQALILQAD